MAESHGEAKGTTAHTEADAHGHSFPPFQKDTFASQLVSLLVAFVALYLIVKRIALPASVACLTRVRAQSKAIWPRLRS